MNVLNKNINNIFFIFAITHLIIWTMIPSLTNSNLPLDTIEALAWGSNLDWGFNKHPPMSAFFSEVFYNIFGSQDWAYYLLSQIFVVISFYFIFKFAFEILRNIKLSLISVLLLEAIYFFNFTTPEFNVNVCQLPFWSLVIYYSWKIYDIKEIQFYDCFLIGLFAAIGFLSKYLFIYLLLSISLLFIYVIYKKFKKFDFKHLIIIEIFLVLLVPHLIWLFDNDFITVSYGLKRSGLEESEILNHIKYPITFLLKQLGILIPFFFLLWLLIKKIELKFNFNDRKFLFLLSISILPIFLIFITSVITGSKIRTMWMTPFYLPLGIFCVYLFRSQINLKKINSFLVGFLFLFFLSPSLYAYVSIKKTDKRTDYPGKEIAAKVQFTWEQDFEKEIEFVTGDEWKAGNLSYHLKSRPKWEGFTKSEILNKSSQFICLDDICLGRY
ncbi:glycosyltransferase family 39 protein [Candidatus Pelagibacter sp.]|nr:glycosyltransferase family 39 protein [Candidatus Pelagibacter sp.]